MNDNKEIQVRGYGRLTRPRIQNKIAEYLDIVLQNRNDLKNPRALKEIFHALYGNGVLRVMLDAELQEMKNEEK